VRDVLAAAHRREATGAGLNASKLGTTKRKDGKLQVTYNGHPALLLPTRQKAAHNGQGYVHFGGSWWTSRCGRENHDEAVNGCRCAAVECRRHEMRLELDEPTCRPRDLGASTTIRKGVR